MTTLSDKAFSDVNRVYDTQETCGPDLALHTMCRPIPIHGTGMYKEALTAV